MATDNNPFGDIAKIMSQFQMPGLDMSAFVHSRQKDIETLIQANAAAYESMQALARKQNEMLAEAMHTIQEAARGALPGAGGTPDLAKQGELARKACEKAMADFTALAEMARRSNAEVLEKMTQRAIQSAEEIRALMQPKR